MTMLLRTLTLAGALTVSLATAAGAADPPPDIESARTRCLEAVAKRFVTIDELQAKVTDATALTDSHEGQLEAELAGAESGLIALRPQIEVATTGAELRDLCPKVANDYRVYVLEGPTVHLTIGGDTAVSAGDRLDEIANRLGGAIADAQALGADVGDAEVLLAEMRTSINTARTLASPVGEAVIPLTPADYNAGTAQPVLAAAETDMLSAKTELRAAGDDARAIVEILRAI